MARIQTRNARIAGIANAVPERSITTEETATNLDLGDPSKVVAMTGIRKRHVVTPDVCTSDLCASAAKNLLSSLSWAPGSVDALIFVTQTPDYHLPATACILQDRLGLSKSCAAFDVNLGCSGYVYGLFLASSLVESGLSRVLLLAGDTPSKIICEKDKSTIFLFGDAGTATAIERRPGQLSFITGTDGSGAKHLMIPSGCYRDPGDATSHDLIEREGGNYRNQHQLYMNGAEVMSFTLRSLPPLWADLLNYSQVNQEEIDAVVMHQANQFILNTIAKRLGFESSKVPSTLEQFGNTSSASIPMTIVERLGEKLSAETQKLALLGFGVGWSWAGCVGDFGDLSICETLYL